MTDKQHVFSWFFRGFMLEVLLHLWTFQGMQYTKSDLLRIHGEENYGEIMAALHKLSRYGFVKISATLDNKEITTYEFNKLSPLGNDFNKFYTELLIKNLELIAEQEDAEKQFKKFI